MLESSAKPDRKKRPATRPTPIHGEEIPRNRILVGDCLAEMRSWPAASVDHCIVDPPFNIGSGSGRKGKAGLGWAFSSHVTMAEQWDAYGKDEFFAFNVEWLREVSRVVKPNGNILVFGTYHNIYQLGFIIQDVLERRVLNSVIWSKPNAQPNITARMLTESTEQVIWAVNNTPAKATGWTFNYWDAKEMNGGKQMRNVWEFPVTAKRERAEGKHPSQKPLGLLERAVLLASKPGELILDPFGGSGTLALAAAKHGRDWLLIEKDQAYVDIAGRRLAAAG